MGFRREVRERLQEISDFTRVIKVFHEAEIERLIAQNKELMDRFMARDFESLKTYQLGQNFSASSEGLSPDEDEGNAGEILDIEA